MLVQVNLKEKVVNVIDPGKALEAINGLLVNLFVYLRSELTFHRSEAIAHSPWSELRFKATVVAPSLHSGIYISQTAYTTSTGKTPSPRPNFRLRMLKSISVLSIESDRDS